MKGKGQKKLSKNSVLILLQSAKWALRLTWATNKWLLIGLLLIATVLGLVPVGLAAILRNLIDAVSTAARSKSGMTTDITFWLVATFLVTLADVIGSYIYKYLTQRLGDEMNVQITTDVLIHAAELDVPHFEDPRFQDMLERMQQNIANRFTQFVTQLLRVWNNGLQMMTLSAILITIEPIIAIVLFAVALPYLFFQWQLAKLRYKEQYFRITKMRWTRYFVTRLTSQEWVPEIKMLGLAPLFIDKFKGLMGEFRDQNRRIYGRLFGGSALFAALSSLAFFVTFARVTVRAVAGALTIGDVAIYGGATARLRNALENAIVAMTEALEQTLHINNLREFLDVQSQIDDVAGIRPSTCAGDIIFDDVTFTYPGTKKEVLKNTSFTIRAGETVAIVGRNGAGKTTLVKLLARLYEPTGGVIRLDGRALPDLSLAYLHQQVSFVFQRFGRYEATVAENIAYGDWERLLHDREQVERIAEMAGVADMIAQMPEGYDTMLGRMFGEYTLSGGQWQKIAIARAFARDAALIILDEPTSNLDAASEFRIFTNFRELAQGRTAVLISHRFSTVSMADRILVMDRGCIVEQGTHDELLVQDGVYANLYALHRRQMDGK